MKSFLKSDSCSNIASRLTYRCSVYSTTSTNTNPCRFSPILAVTRINYCYYHTWQCIPRACSNVVRKNHRCINLQRPCMNQPPSREAACFSWTGCWPACLPERLCARTTVQALRPRSGIRIPARFLLLACLSLPRGHRFPDLS
jgi:hypothetical protein